MFNPQNTHLDQSKKVNSQPQALLKRLTDYLINSSLPLAVRNNSQIVNDIPDKLTAHTDESVVTAVMKGVLGAVLNNAKDTCIRISARLLYGNRVEVFIKDPNSYHTYAIACGLQDVVPLAAKIGGDINITNQREKITTVSFTFPA